MIGRGPACKTADDRVEVRGDGVFHRRCRGRADGARRRVAALAPRAGGADCAAEALGLPGTLKSELFASALELNTGVCASAAEGAARHSPSCGAERLGSRRSAACGSRRRKPPVQPGRGAGDRGRGALRRVRRVRGRLGSAARRQRAARPRRDAERGSVLSRARGRASLAARWCSPVGELAVLRRRGDGARLQPGGGAGAASAARRSAGFSLLRGVGGVRRALHPARPRRRLHEVLVGHPAASALRHPRDPDARPADGARAHGRLRRAPQGPVRRGPRRPPLPHDPAGARHVPAEPLGGFALRARRRARAPGRRQDARASELATELAALAGEDGLDPTRMEADRQLEVGRADGLEAVCADLVERTLG